MTVRAPGSGNPADAQLASIIARQAGELLVALRAAQGDPADVGARGDAQSNELILERLGAERPDDAVLSEESVDDLARLRARRVWIVDPLDGTREFAVPGRSDWAVHVALWERGAEITAAAVALPALGVVYGSDEVTPIGPATAAEPAEPADRGDRGDRQAMRIVVSQSRPPGFVAALAQRLGAEVITLGSAGAKAMAVLRGGAEAYVHAGGQWEWDSAAPVGVVLAAGLHASRIDGSPLRYNQERPYLPDLLVCQPELAGRLLAALQVVA